MPLNSQLSDTGANAALNALTALLNGGFMKFYSGTQPANANSPLSGNTLLATLGFGTPAFAPSVAGVAAANSISPEASAPNSGTATWYRLYKSDGTTVVCDGSIGTSGCNINVNSQNVVAGQSVSVTSFTLTLPES
jgi:hypothetical protein